MSLQNQTLTIKQPKHSVTNPRVGANAFKQRALIRLGLRSQCCGAKIVTWHHDKSYCSSCDGWVRK